MAAPKYLTSKHYLFAQAYVTNGFNGSAAYKEIFSCEQLDDNSVAASASRLLNNVNVRKYLKAIVTEKLSQYKDTLEKQIVDVYMKRAFFDLANYTDDVGNININKIKNDGYSQVIDGIEVKYHGKDANKKTITYKTGNRDRAIEMLAKYIRIMDEHTTVEHQGEISINRVPASTVKIQDRDENKNDS